MDAANEAFAAGICGYEPALSSHVTSWGPKSWGGVYSGERNAAVRTWLDEKITRTEAGGGSAGTTNGHHCFHRGFVVVSAHLIVLPVTRLNFPSLKPHPHITVATRGWSAAASDALLGAIFKDRGTAGDGGGDWVGATAAATGAGECAAPSS
jgi:hypothetical protein